MILNACAMPSGCGFMSSRLSNPVPCRSVFTSSIHLPAENALFIIRSSWEPHQDFKSSSPVRGLHPLHLSAASTSLFSGDQGGIPYLPRRRRSNLVPRASRDLFKGFSYPPMTKRPRWWWRTLSCLPYLLPLHQSWMYAETAYNLHPFLEAFESWTTPFLEAVGRLPRWSFLAYFVVGYLFVVRRQEWPHFFRFHVVMGLLLEIALHVTGALNRVTPGAVYWGKIGMHFWTIFFFGFLFTVLECMRCALAGMYADVPYVCKAAYVQIPVENN
ncbi:hypothetical protein SLEP1_g4050 [Rubroshorea leprosula]|uniref:Protein TIC 20 n=1 Tax=Rubroshorea leprosula TaxID=152421 RepID=A0AAV5HT67_9ROSI|nr:hypothetical protein SLEP1_g4050 [Rubroshorea leprosula]